MRVLFLLLLLYMQAGCVSKAPSQIPLSGIWVSERAFEKNLLCKGVDYGVSLRVESEGMCKIQLEPNKCIWGAMPQGPVDCSIRDLGNNKYIVSTSRSKKEYLVTKSEFNKLLITNSNTSGTPKEYNLVLNNYQFRYPWNTD